MINWVSCEESWQKFERRGIGRVINDNSWWWYFCDWVNWNWLTFFCAFDKVKNGLIGSWAFISYGLTLNVHLEWRKTDNLQIGRNFLVFLDVQGNHLISKRWVSVNLLSDRVISFSKLDTMGASCGVELSKYNIVFLNESGKVLVS